MDVNEYYADNEEQIINDESLSEAEKSSELDSLRRECQGLAEEEAARDAEADGYRRYR